MTQHPDARPAGDEGFVTRASAFVADAIRYWEPRRVVYNIALGAIVVGHVAARWPDSRSRLTVDVLLGLFFLAVLANVCYCAVYVADLFVQFSGLREFWAKGRVAVLIVGTAFAGVIAHFLFSGMLSGS